MIVRKKNRTAIHPPPHGGVTKNGFSIFSKLNLQFRRLKKSGTAHKAGGRTVKTTAPSSKNF